MFKANKIKISSKADTTITLIVIGGLMLYYFLIYIPSNRDRIEKLRFKALELAVDNVQFRLNNYQNLLDNYKGIYEKRKDTVYSCNDINCSNSALNLKLVEQIQQRNSKLFSVNLITHGKSASADSVTQSQSDTIKLHSKTFLDSNSVAGFFEAKINYNYFFEPILKKGLFTDYIVFNKHNGRVVYQTKTNGIRIFNLDSLFNGRKGFVHPVLTDVAFNGENAKIFLQEFQDNTKKVDWIIAGIVPQKIYNGESTRIESNVLMLLVFLLVLFVLFIPWLKFILLGKNEQIRLGDLVRTGVSCMLIVSVATFMFFSENFNFRTFKPHVNSKSEKRDSKAQFAKMYSERLRTELSKNLSILSEFETSYQNSEYSNHSKSIIDEISTTVARDSALRIDSSSYNLTKKSSFLRVFWLDNEGNEVAQYSKDNNRILFGNYGDRNYFKDAVNANLFTFYGDNGKNFHYAFEPVYSWESDRYNMVVAFPVKDSFARVAAASFQLSTLEDVILPYGFQFAITDKTGRIILHSDSSRNLNDNILFYDNSERALESSLQTSTSKFIATLVDNVPMTIMLEPVINTPFFVAIYSNQNIKIARDEQVFLETWMLLAALFFFLIVELLVIVAIHKRKNNQLKNYSHRLSWIFPRTTQVVKYQFISRINLLQFFILIAFMMFCNMFQYLFVLANAIILSTYYANTIQIHNRNNPLTFSKYFSLTSGLLSKILIISVILVNILSYLIRNDGDQVITPTVLFSVVSLTVFFLFCEYVDLKEYLQNKWISPVMWSVFLIFSLLFLIISSFIITATELKHLVGFYCLSATIGLSLSVRAVIRRRSDDAKIKKFTEAYSMVILTRLLITSALPIAAFYHYCYEFHQELNVKSRLEYMTHKIDEQYNSGIPAKKIALNIAPDNFYVNTISTYSVPVRCLSRIKTLSDTCFTSSTIFVNADDTNDPNYCIYDSTCSCSPLLASFGKKVNTGYWNFWKPFNFMASATNKLANFEMSKTKLEKHQDRRLFFNSPQQSKAEMLFIPHYPILHDTSQLNADVFYISSEEIINYPLPLPISINGYIWWIVLFLAWALLFSLIHFFVRTLFGAKLPTFLKYDELHKAILKNSELSKLLFVTGLPGSGKRTYIVNELYKMKYRIKNLGSYMHDSTDLSSLDLNKNEPWKEGILLDLFLIPDTSNPSEEEAQRWENEVNKIMDPKFTLVIINNFEYNHLDHVTNRIKLNLIESLLGTRKKIVIVSSLDYKAFLFNIEEKLNKAQNTNNENIQQITNDLERWNSLLGHFTNIYIPLTDNSTPGKEVHKYKNWRNIVNNECAHTKVLNNLKEELEFYFDNLDPQLDDDQLYSDIVLKIQNTLEQYYVILWNSLTMEEKLITYDLAEDGLVNTRNNHAIFVLINKGLFKYDYGQLKLFNKSFRNFVLTSIGRIEADKLEAKISSESSWKRYKTPVVILITALMFFILYSDQQRFNDVVIPYVTSFIAVIPILFRLFSIMNTTDSSK